MELRYVITYHPLNLWAKTIAIESKKEGVPESSVKVQGGRQWCAASVSGGQKS